MIEDKLREYNYNVARTEWLNLEIETLKENIKALREQLKDPGGVYETDKTTIEAMTLGRNIDGLPKGTGIYNKVEKIAETYKKEQQEIQKPKDPSIILEEITTLAGRVKAYEYEKDILQKDIACVKACIKVLTRDERFVIKKQYFEGLQWRYICIEYMKAFGAPREERTLQGYRQKALEKMGRICNE